MSFTDRLKANRFYLGAQRIFRRSWSATAFVFTAQDQSTDFDRDIKLMQGRQDNVVIWLTGASFALIVAFLAVVGWQREFSSAYLATKAAITHFDSAKQQWFVSYNFEKDCDGKDECYRSLKSKSLESFDFKELTKPWLGIQKSQSNDAKSNILLQTTIDRDAWLRLYDLGYRRLMIGLPTASYLEAYVYVNGKMAGTFLKGSRIGVPVTFAGSVPKDLVVEVLYIKDWNYSGLFEADDEPLIITGPGEYNAWVRMLIMKSATRGSWISDLAFIVMAAFFLMLYLFVDSSPEVLGLALFVSMDALSRSFGYGWLPFSFIDAFGSSLDSAAQIMRLYFLLQLGRIGSPRVRPWLWAAFIYAAFASAGSWADSFGSTLIPDHTNEINVWCSMFVSIFGLAIASTTAVRLRRRQLPWRQWALIIAAIACFLQFVAYINYIFPVLENYNVFFQFRSIIIPLSVYLLASSAFVNISTLENRVRMLSDAKSKNDLIEKELELGRVVQNAYMKIPELPAEVDISCYFEAAFYVSGDAYFVHWDPGTKRMAIILGDMTGHGVHAALKSTTLQVIARTIFRDPMRRGGDLGGRFKVYEQTLRSFLRESWGDGDLPTFLGVEMDLDTGILVSHRANFPFPLVVYRTQEGVWNARMWVNSDETLDFKKDMLEAFILSATDGILGSSKQISKLCRNLTVELAMESSVTANTIKDVVLRLTPPAKPGTEDDKTMIVFGLKKPEKAA
jgi:hypothetical protein